MGSVVRRRKGWGRRDLQGGRACQSVIMAVNAGCHESRCIDWCTHCVKTKEVDTHRVNACKSKEHLHKLNTLQLERPLQSLLKARCLARRVDQLERLEQRRGDVRRVPLYCEHHRLLELLDGFLAVSADDLMIHHGGEDGRRQVAVLEVTISLALALELEKGERRALGGAACLGNLLEERLRGWSQG